MKTQKRLWLPIESIDKNLPPVYGRRKLWRASEAVNRIRRGNMKQPNFYQFLSCLKSSCWTKGCLARDSKFVGHFVSKMFEQCNSTGERQQLWNGRAFAGISLKAPAQWLRRNSQPSVGKWQSCAAFVERPATSPALDVTVIRKRRYAWWLEVVLIWNFRLSSPTFTVGEWFSKRCFSGNSTETFGSLAKSVLQRVPEISTPSQLFPFWATHGQCEESLHGIQMSERCSHIDHLVPGILWTPGSFLMSHDVLKL